jgi:UDP-4-amino-4,6-dideoxy-N-acetyl-beta-L-altrosamine N-acetyltransferase
MAVNLVKMRDVSEHTELVLRLISECRPYLYSDRTVTAETHRAFLASLPPDDNLWIFERDGLPVGVVSVYHKDFTNSRCEWGRFMLDSRCRGGGIGSIVEFMILDFVFRRLKFHKLFCEVLSENETVVSLHQKFGFTVEGTFRQHVMKAGMFRDVTYLGIFEDEWEAKRGRFEAMFKDKVGAVEV